MTLLRTFDRVLVKIETAFLVLFLAVMIVLSFSQVVLRNAFNTGLLWADPLVRHLLIWAGFLGAAIATHEERHISIDALTKFFSPKLKAIAQILTSLFAVIVCYYLADAALVFLRDEKAAGSEFVLSIPLWVAIIIIPAGYALMGVHFVVKIVENAGKLLSADSSGTTTG
jgi:TRAP-type C4-dicarboxylate transport system permease small subunit